MRGNAVVVSLAALIAVLFGQGSSYRCADVLSPLSHAREDVEWFRRRYGDYPDSLEQVCMVFHPSDDCVIAYSLFDFWGRRLSYRRGQSGYELFSNGPDALPNTEDDVMLYVRSPVCAQSPLENSMGDPSGYCPCRTAAKSLLHLDYEIRAFRYFTNQYPEGLDELDKYFRAGVRNLWINIDHDPWGEPYRYSVDSTDYVLFSSGPDRLPNTDDDVYPGVWPEKCLILLTERTIATLSLIDSAIKLFHFANNEFPKDLDELDIYFAKTWLNDGAYPQNYGYRYGRIPSGYVLYSWGPDREPHTDDDLFAPVRAACRRTSLNGTTEDTLMLMDLGIILFRYYYSRYPRLISELEVYFNKTWLDTAVDQWGEPFRYNLTPTGYALVSNGPDRLPNTDDDVSLRSAADKCRLPSQEVQRNSLPLTRKPQSGCGCSVCED